MEKTYDHRKYERKIYSHWEKSGSFTPKIDKKKKSYTIVLPPPNASGKMHTGNVLMIAIEDLLIRWKRMQGYSALWLPGTDHAGFETQITFERELKAKGKARFDFDRNTLYEKIEGFVLENKGLIEEQIRNMGASVDWSRYKFTLDPDVIETVVNTFEKLHKDELVYRDDYMVNYCPICGTTFADLEVRHKERKDPLYFLKYGPFSLATVRPETKFGDTAVAVHPDDKRYKKYIGKEIEFESLIGRVKLKVIGDSAVDPEFGTGVVKVTPSHDFNDFEMGKRHNLPMRQVIGFDGRLTSLTGKYKGLKVAEARRIVSEDLKKEGLLEKIDERYTHTVATCYKCGRVLEPLPLEQWFVKVKPLADAALNAIKKGEIKFIPKRFEKTASIWLLKFLCWEKSPPSVWGGRL